MYKAILASVISVGLIGCGGGGGGAAPTSTTPTTPTTPVAGSAELELYAADIAEVKAASGFSVAADAGLTGSGVTVGMFDTGMLETHEQFDNTNLATGSGNYLTRWVLEATPLADPTGFDSLYQGAVDDEDGHGTHVASIIIGKDTGLAPSTDLYLIDNTSSNGVIHPWVFQDHLEQAIADGVRIFNVSQTTCISRNSIDVGLTHYADSLTALDANNGVVVCGSGNESADLTKELVTKTTTVMGFDANDGTWAKEAGLKDNFIYVGSVNTDGVLSAAFSNFPGADTDIQSRWIVAVGENVVGAAIMNDSNYIIMDGTSQAAPMVTSALALMKEKFPSLNATQLTQALLNTADKTFAGYDVTKHGQGMLDVEAALAINPADY